MIEYRRYHDFERPYRDYTPLTRAGQIIQVCKGKKKIPVKVTEPNRIGGNIAIGTANGKTFTCWFNNGSWSMSRY